MILKKDELNRVLNKIFFENEANLELNISEIEPNKNQPRHDFDENSLRELANSISQHGVLQPLLVRPLKDGGYQIIAGERRWRASQMAGLSELPVIVKNLTDSEVMEIALIENLQRENLSPIEEAQGYRYLIGNYNFTQEQISEKTGKSRSVIANSLRLLALPNSVISMVSKGQLSAGHARTLLSLKNKEDIEKMAKKVIEKNLTVRELEKICKNFYNENKVATKERKSLYDELEKCLKEELGRTIKINSKEGKNSKGVLEIEFYDDHDLSDIANRLSKKIIEKEGKNI